MSTKGEQSRRSAIETSGKALAALLLSSQIATATDSAASKAQYNDSIPQMVIMTGMNSGISYNAAKRMAARGHTIIMSCRTLEKATDAAACI